MSGAVRAGLIFGVVGLVLAAAFTFIFPLCVPVAALAAGALAGYFGVKWSVANPTLGQGVLASAIAGVLLLVGGAVLVIVGFGALLNNPQFADAVRQAAAQQNSDLSPQDLETALSATGPIIGVCLGIVNLIAALIGGVIAALIAARNNAPTQTPPTYTPPTAPPMT